MASTADFYPANFRVDYPERPLDRVSTLLRIVWIIPIAIIAGLLSGGNSEHSEAGGQASYQYAATGLVVVPTILMLLFRQKYPRWWFDWNIALTAFGYRVFGYFALLRDEYPSTDEEQAYHLSIPYPDAAQLSRWLPLVKWLLAIPHYIVLFFLAIAAMVCVVIAWFAILFTGTYPRGLFDFVVGVLRWGIRVSAYAFILATDRYPPFSLNA